ncbi:hypothetical protein SAMN05443668_109326 [Cryptosporangium aurantiacum]|uniref:Short C-terminal domain-containing protein n=1 Tax=Cryptosporangium aurantiacum TaxID=134849 RepID=A0A1M7RC84_9ACTN|nr:hypothetical protein SAMN05443668_109326 [Cryptosporangium aurantiacum]
MRVLGQSEQITFDGTWVTVHRKGEPVRPGDRRVHVQDIISMELKTSRFSGGQFTIEVAGPDGLRPIAELTVAFRGGRQDDFARLRAFVEASRAAALAQHQQPAAPAPPDPADELRRLWQLVQVGQLSKEEFEEAKRQLF